MLCQILLLILICTIHSSITVMMISINYDFHDENGHVAIAAEDEHGEDGLLVNYLVDLAN